MSINGHAGLAMGVVVTDDNEARLPIPKNYGVDEFPIILQDRTFHDNQLDYRQDYDPMGVFGEVPLINGAVKPFVDVTTRKVRLLFLGGSDRREWRLHFEHDLTMTQIGGDDSFLRHQSMLKSCSSGQAKDSKSSLTSRTLSQAIPLPFTPTTSSWWNSASMNLLTLMQTIRNCLLTSLRQRIQT